VSGEGERERDEEKGATMIQNKHKGNENKGYIYRGGKRMGSTKKDKETHPEDDAVEMMGER
jgi:hypothetical protein